MADIRINGRRFPVLQAVDSLGSLVQKIEAMGQRNNTFLTSLSLNGRNTNLDSTDFMRIKLASDDKIDARMESSEQLAFESLHTAQEMAELLIFDLKVATLHLWENTRQQDKSLETLINDCSLFLTLGARPHELLGQNPNDLEGSAKECLKNLDAVANHIEDATLLAANGHFKESCHVMVARVIPSIERWLGLTPLFAEQLQLDTAQPPMLNNDWLNQSSL